MRGIWWSMVGRRLLCFWRTITVIQWGIRGRLFILMKCASRSLLSMRLLLVRMSECDGERDESVVFLVEGGDLILTI